MDLMRINQGSGDWEDEEEEEPHLAYPGPHARGQVCCFVLLVFDTLI